jgi:hypothetical protein
MAARIPTQDALPALLHLCGSAVIRASDDPIGPGCNGFTILRKASFTGGGYGVSRRPPGAGRTP